MTINMIINIMKEIIIIIIIEEKNLIIIVEVDKKMKGMIEMKGVIE